MNMNNIKLTELQNEIKIEYNTTEISHHDSENVVSIVEYLEDNLQVEKVLRKESKNGFIIIIVQLREYKHDSRKELADSYTTKKFDTLSVLRNVMTRNVNVRNLSNMFQ